MTRILATLLFCLQAVVCYGQTSIQNLPAAQALSPGDLFIVDQLVSPSVRRTGQAPLSAIGSAAFSSWLALPSTWTAVQTFSSGIVTGTSLTLTAHNGINNSASAGGFSWYNSTDTSVTSIIPGLFTVIASQSGPAGGNAIIGAAVQDVTSSLSLPAGVTMYGKLAAAGAGNLIFGGFGRVDISAAGSAANEFDCNNTNADSPSTFPPVIVFPLASTYCIGVQSASIGTKKSHSAFRALIGVGGSPWLAGLYMDPTCCSTYGYFIDATSTQGPQYTSYLRNSGASGNVVQTLQTMGTYNASRTVWQILDASGNQIVKATEDGGIVTISSPLAASTDAVLWNLSNNNTGATSAAFTATTNGGVMRLESDTVAGGAAGVIRFDGPGPGAGLPSFFIDAKNATGNISFRTGATPNTALTINAAQVVGIVPATWVDNQTCTAGQFTVDANFIYVCTSANTVKRAALSAF